VTLTRRHLSVRRTPKPRRLINICGIFGVYYSAYGHNAEQWSPDEFLQAMFPAIEHRGRHAWGYMYYDTASDDIAWFKQAGSARAKGARKEMVVEGAPGWIVGHVRAATTGTPRVLANNHPIVHGKIIGVHNGIIRNYRDILKQTGREDPKAEVDSEAIFAAINHWGSKTGLPKLRGDMVAVYTHDAHPHVLRIARSDYRPLVYGWTDTGTFVFASESLVLKDAGITLAGEPVHWSAENAIMRLALRPNSGVISRTVEFFAPPRPRFTPPPASGTVLGSYPPAESHHGRGWSSDIGVVDEFGGTYLGMNRWRVPLGNNTSTVVGAAEYIRRMVNREVNHRLEVLTNPAPLALEAGTNEEASSA
jgi:hypothetical protein